MKSLPWPRLRRAAFWLYLPTLFTATHWPKLTLPGTGRPDLIVHLFAFGLWTALFIGAGFFGPALSWRNIRVAFLIAPLYAAIDEGLQAIPFVHRTAAFDDWLANLSGILLACFGALILMKRAARKTPAVADPSPQ